MKRMDPILKLLLGGILFFTVVLLYCQMWFPNDGQTFQVIAGLLTGFAGAFLGFAKKELGVEDPPHPVTAKTETQEPK